MCRRKNIDFNFDAYFATMCIDTKIRDFLKSIRPQRADSVVNNVFTVGAKSFSLTAGYGFQTRYYFAYTTFAPKFSVFFTRAPPFRVRRERIVRAENRLRVEHDQFFKSSENADGTRTGRINNSPADSHDARGPRSGKSRS